MYIKQLFYKGLDKIPVYIEDTLQNSPYYFNIIDIPKVFGPGKNSIRFSLNDNNLDVDKNIDIEVIDSYGNTIYHEVPTYSQKDEFGVKVATIYFYNNISNGPVKITLVGHAKIGLNGEPIPQEFQNSYNVRYTTYVEFNRFQKNTSRILFSEPPSISISETRKAYVSKSINTPSVTVTGSGIYRYQHTYPLLELNNGTFINDMLNAQLSVTMSSVEPEFQGYQTSSFNTYQSNIINIFNARTAILNIPWTASINSIGSEVAYGNIKTANVNYSITYTPSVTASAVNNFNSFVNLQMSNLEPVSGYIKYVKLYGKSQGSLAQYELIGESVTENNELLINNTSLIQYDRSNVGYFLDSSSFANFWSYNNSLLSVQYNSSSLFNSLQLTPLVNTEDNDVLFTSDIDVNFQKDSSYRLYFNYNSQSDFIIEVYASGSAFADKTGLGQRVFYLDSRAYSPSYVNFPIDFIASSTGTAKIQFKILTGSLYISDISLKSGINEGFNPSNFNSYFPINVKRRNDVYDFKVELIDDNGQVNSFEFNNGANSNILITGSNAYIANDDNLLSGRLNLGEESSRGISLNGFDNSISTYGFTGSAGWMLWSGSKDLGGSVSSGSGFMLETGAPFYHYIRAEVGGKIESNAFLSSGSIPISVRDFGAKGDGITDDTSYFLLATSGSNGFYVPAGTYVISSSIEINKPVMMFPGAKLLISSGSTVTFSKGFEAGLDHCFDGPGNVYFSAGSVTHAYIQWFGAVSNDDSKTFLNDISTAFQKVLDCGAVIKIPAGYYYLAHTVTIDKPCTVNLEQAVYPPATLMYPPYNPIIDVDRNNRTVIYTDKDIDFFSIESRNVWINGGMYDASNVSYNTNNHAVFHYVPKGASNPESYGMRQGGITNFLVIGNASKLIAGKPEYSGSIGNGITGVYIDWINAEAGSYIYRHTWQGWFENVKYGLYETTGSNNGASNAAWNTIDFHVWIARQAVVINRMTESDINLTFQSAPILNVVEKDLAVIELNGVYGCQVKAKYVDMGINYTSPSYSWSDYYLGYSHFYTSEDSTGRNFYTRTNADVDIGERNRKFVAGQGPGISNAYADGISGILPSGIKGTGKYEGFKSAYYSNVMALADKRHTVSYGFYQKPSANFTAITSSSAEYGCSASLYVTGSNLDNLWYPYGKASSPSFTWFSSASQTDYAEIVIDNIDTDYTSRLNQIYFVGAALSASCGINQIHVVQEDVFGTISTNLLVNCPVPYTRVLRYSLPLNEVIPTKKLIIRLIGQHITGSTQQVDISDFAIFPGSFVSDLNAPLLSIAGNQRVYGDLTISGTTSSKANLTVGTGRWNGTGLLKLGNYSLWVDSSNNLRMISGSTPSSDGDGFVVNAGDYATKFANSFTGDQNITGSLIVNSTGQYHTNIGNNSLFISSSGNVGIGTNNPGEKLVVNGMIYGIAPTEGRGLVVQSPGGATLQLGASVTGTIRAFLGYGSQERIILTSDGTIFLPDSTIIGTNPAGGASPSRLLVRGSGVTSATTTLIVENSAQTPALKVLDDTTIILDTIGLNISGSINFGEQQSYISSVTKVIDVKTTTKDIFEFNSSQFVAATGDIKITNELDTTKYRIVRFSIGIDETTPTSATADFTDVVTSGDTSALTLSIDASSGTKVIIQAVASSGEYTVRVSQVNLLKV